MTDQERINNLYRENHELREHLKELKEANQRIRHKWMEAVITYNAIKDAIKEVK